MQMYFIAVVLPATLNEKVSKLKQMMFEKYNCKVGLKSPAHITLVPPFWLEYEKEEPLISEITALSNAFNPFPISTDNFSAFQPRTIFIAVAPNEQLNKLKEATNHFFKNKPFCNVKIDERPFHPHITIATRDLFKKSFFDIWPWFAGKKFEEEFFAEGISILRHNKKNWDVIYTSQLNKVY